ncbi:MAG TPA: hypothetical protein VIY69_03325, partial [Candidatus Acidoferrales bacterium]
MPPLMKKALLFIERSLAVRSIESEDLHKPLQYRTWTLGTGSTIFVHALIVVSITVPLFWLNRDNLLGFIDGQYLLTLIHSEKELTPFRLGFSTNPLQGLDDLQYLFNTRWIPELAIASVLPGVWGKIAAQTAAALELFIGIGLLASWLGAGTKKTIIAAWVAALAFAPLSWPSLFYGITSDAPQLASLTVTTILVVPLWAGIGKGALWQDAVRTGAISLIVWICATAFGLFILLTAPFLVVFCTVFLIASRHAHVEFRRKLIWTACLLFMLALSGLPQALLGITLDSSFHFFREQTYRPQHRLFDGSFLFRPNERVSWSLVMLGLGGTALNFGFGNQRTRYFAAATLILVAFIVIASLFYAAFGGFVAIPRYYETVLWPIYAMFAAFLICDSWQIIRVGILKQSQVSVRVWSLLAVPFVVVLLLHGSNYMANWQNPLPNVYPPKASVITALLSSKIGLARDSLFRGRVVTLTGQGVANSVSWGDMFDRDVKVIDVLGNEYRTIGLWYYNIPTLIEFSHTIPPLFYAVATRYLVRPGDTQDRNILNLRFPNLQILRLLGVRYIITDGGLTPGTVRILSQGARRGMPPLAVDEIADVNLGISPVQSVPLVSTSAALSWLGERNVDFKQVAILEGVGGGPFQAARDISIRV